AGGAGAGAGGAGGDITRVGFFLKP
ncbi:MAG: hypothetical protein RLZZ338_3908, partial [Cyanobacteriota bacterium]